MKKNPSVPQAVVIKTDGTAQLVPCDASKSLPLDKLHELVGGYVEVVRASRIAPLVMIVNEEGKLLGLPLNKNATAWQSAIHGFQQIVGDAKGHLTDRRDNRVRRQSSRQDGIRQKRSVRFFHIHRIDTS